MVVLKRPKLQTQQFCDLHEKMDGGAECMKNHIFIL